DGSSLGSRAAGHQRRSRDSRPGAGPESGVATARNRTSRWRVPSPPQNGTSWTSSCRGTGSSRRPGRPDSSVASRSAASASVRSVGSTCPPSWNHWPAFRCRVRSAASPSGDM
ncbi:MAG: hypothetical protein AVDCRST_MAG34-2177, partial [uncultured Nocardioidaceae bacterium]